MGKSYRKCQKECDRWDKSKVFNKLKKLKFGANDREKKLLIKCVNKYGLDTKCSHYLRLTVRFDVAMIHTNFERRKAVCGEHNILL